MPILVKDYTWKQSNKMINIWIPINSNHESVDIFSTDSYIKVNFSPFLFEIFLLHDIDGKKSKGIIKDNEIVLDLLKKEEANWDCLEKDLTKAEKLKLKREILEKCQEEAKQEYEEKRVKKTQLERFTVQQAMEIDSKHHEVMESRKNDERNKAMNALEEWRVKTVENANCKQKPMIMESSGRKGCTIVELPSSEDETEKTIPKEIKPPTKPRKLVKNPVRSEYVESKKKEVAERVLPKLRESGSLEITHTARTFPTPSRESSAAEEEAWLKNVTLARRATGFVSEDLRPEEQDPQWCKEKGDEFFRNGNFLGAISAYSHGIHLSEKLPTLYANRAATHFALGNFNRCLNDCSTALDLMKPACEGNRRSRAKCIARRAAALARLGYLSKAIDEMKAAAKLLPDDEGIKKDVYDMEKAWEQNPDSD